MTNTKNSQERPDAPLTDDERGRAAAYLARVRNAELTGIPGIETVVLPERLALEKGLI